jgi:cytochrome c-type biogenesis protein CcmH
MSATFVVLCALMALAALAAVIWPYLSHAPRGRRWPPLLIAFIAVPLLAAGLYASLSEWDWGAGADSSEVPAAVQQMIRGLEERMKSEPGNLDGWLMLGRSYFQLERFAQAAQAYQRAYTLSRGGNVDAVLGLGEAMAFDDESTLAGPAAELFEQGMEMAPDHPKALWYGGLVAHQQGRLEVARERWSKLLQGDLPDDVRQLLQTKLIEIDGQLAGGRGAAGVTGDAGAQAAGNVRVRVSLAPELADRVTAGAPLFVMARVAGSSGGPPIAVRRLDAAQLPLLVELTDRDAMMAGATLSAMGTVTVVARVALGGTPQARSGDLQGQVDLAVGAEPAQLIIDTVVR